MGVFTRGVPKGPAPQRLDLTDIKSSRTYEPILNQTFFIGDGLTQTGKGRRQRFRIPNDATELFFGFADAVSFKGQPETYGDNIGELVVTYNIEFSEYR